MNDQVFELLQTQHQEVMSRFDALEAAHAEHLKEDREVHQLVERHNMYFNIAFLGLPTILATVAYKLGYKP